MMDAAADGKSLTSFAAALMMFHVTCADVEVMAVADLQREDSGRPDGAVSCLLKAAADGCRCRHRRRRLLGHFTPVWASWCVGEKQSG